MTSDDGLTAAMVNNYTKSGLVPRAEGKKYNRDHLAYLTAICVLKRVMSTKDMDLLIREELQGDRPISDGYAAFCASLDKALHRRGGRDGGAHRRGGAGGRGHPLRPDELCRRRGQQPVCDAAAPAGGRPGGGGARPRPRAKTGRKRRRRGTDHA